MTRSTALTVAFGLLLGGLFPQGAFGQDLPPELQYEILEVRETGDRNYKICYRRGDTDSVHTGTIVPGNLTEPSVTSQVRREGEAFEYWYRVRNGKQARTGLERIEVPVRDVVTEVFGPGEKTHERSPTNRLFGSNHEWFGKYADNRSIMRWLYRGDITEGVKRGIPPGVETGELALRSPGVPTIVQGEFSNPTVTSFPDEKRRPMAKLRDKIRSVLDTTGHISEPIIAPRSAPEPFDASAFLDTLATYPQRADSLGWIDGRGLRQSLQAKLESAQQQLSRGNATAAANTLEAFVSEVEAQQGKKLTSEAYALLKFNAEFLIERLRQEIGNQ